MAQVDALRFIANLQKLFAPNIFDGQEFVAYIDGDSNSLTIQGENILYPPSGNVSTTELASEFENISKQISTLQNKADAVENLFRNISGFITNIETISGNFEGLPDFEFNLLHEDIATLINGWVTGYSDVRNEILLTRLELFRAVEDMNRRLELQPSESCINYESGIVIEIYDFEERKMKKFEEDIRRKYREHAKTP